MNLQHARIWMSSHVHTQPSPEELAYAYLLDIGLSLHQCRELFPQLLNIATSEFYSVEENLTEVLTFLETRSTQMSEELERDKDAHELDPDQTWFNDPEESDEDDDLFSELEEDEEEETELPDEDEPFDEEETE